ncbi:cytochrome P450 71A9-like [Sesamum indicum]|uniref:Cytochrome P450 71A9-like n=1 Tax=Sesamum indicum TaxID=4182 RepID=A0A6I9TUC4_SESIN|nr:cytochrome P450 71A9-like [Sesamum indicum]
MLPILVLLALPIILILYVQKHKPKHARNLRPPGPPGLPFIGNFHQFDAKYPHIYLQSLSKQYGPILSMKLGFRPVVVISSANVVKEIMKSHDLAFSGRPTLVGMQRMSYNGLDIALTSYNDRWREMRKVSNLHLFSAKQVQFFRPLREDEVSMMIKKISRDASLSRVTNLSQIVNTAVTNTVCRLTLAKSSKDEGFARRTKELFDDVQGALVAFCVEDYFPLLGWIDKISGTREKLEQTFRKLDSFYQELIEEHLDKNRPKAMEGDILDILLGLMRDGSSSIATMDHIKAILMNILIAGTDANITLTIWAMTILMKNPIPMKKVQTEIRNLGKKDLIDENEIASLPYLRAVIKEVLRLFPPAPLLAPRETLQECTVNGYEIQPKTLVYINAWAIGRDPEVWKDAEEFVPERFLNSEIDVKGHDPELIPFGIGRRGCPGMMMAMAMAELALANLLYAFDWELPPGMKDEDLDFDVEPGLAMPKKNPLCLLAKPVQF